MRALLVSIPAGALLLSGCTAPPVPPFQPRASVQELMVSIVDPAADVLWDSVGTVVSEDGVDEWAPRTEEEWARVRNSAVALMESGNLLMMGGRARDDRLWMQLSRGLIEAGAAARRAAESRDPDAVFAVGEEVYLACDRCHGVYWVGDAQRGRIREPRSQGE